MTLQLFLNDLSAPAGAVLRTQSIAYLKGLVATVKAAKAIDDRLVLNCDMPLNQLALGPALTIASIRNDGECVEESQYLKTLNNRAPLGSVLAEAHGPDPDAFEYRIPAAAPISAGVAAPALGLAHLLKGLGVSLASAALWCSRDLDLDLLELDAEGEIAQRSVKARNASAAPDVAAHEASLRKDLRPPIRNGRDMWTHRAELLPNLAFIPRTKGQLEDILTGDPLLDQVWIKLSGIDQAIATWRFAKSAHPMFPFNVRPESSSRMNLVKFNDAEGTERTFSDHTDLAPIEGRVHFIVETVPRRHALIGHVGRKLGIG
jgi:hypothetical protein